VVVEGKGVVPSNFLAVVMPMFGLYSCFFRTTPDVDFRSLFTAFGNH